MQRRETERPKRFHDDPRGSQGLAMIGWQVHRPEGVIEDQHTYTSLGTLTQDLAERVRHTTGRAVVQLQRDRALRRAQVFPETREGAVTVLHHLDAVACRQPR